MNATIEQFSTFELDGNDLVLLEDTRFEENLNLKGSIYCKNGRHSLTVDGNISARNIDAGDVKAKNIRAGDIYATDINAENINAVDIDVYDINAFDIKAYDISAYDISAYGIIANDIDARNINANTIQASFILCEKRIKKTEKARTIARSFIQNRSKLEFKEQMPMEEKK